MKIIPALDLTHTRVSAEAAGKFYRHHTPATEGCWLWTGRVHRSGYGVVGPFQVHRLSYAVYVGPIPEDMTVDHLCFVVNCVNPDHLRLLTNSENASNQRSARMTHCKWGHEFTPENTYRKPGNNARHCRACNVERVRRYKARLKGLAA